MIVMWQADFAQPNTQLPNETSFSDKGLDFGGRGAETGWCMCKQWRLAAAPASVSAIPLKFDRRTASLIC